MSSANEKLKEIVKNAEEKSRKIISENFSGQVTANNFVELQEVAVEIAFFACYMGKKHFKFDKQRLIDYITEGINLRFETMESNENENKE